MSCNEVTAPIQRTLQTLQTTEYLFEDFSDWMPVMGVDLITAVIKVPYATSTTFSAKFAIQFAAVRPDNPSAWTEYDSAIAGSAEGFRTATITTAAATMMWYRLGVGSKYVSGSAGFSDVTLQASWHACGRVLDARALQLFTLVSAEVGAVVISDWVPLVEAGIVRAALEVYGETKTSGTFKFQLAYQVANAEIETPGTWFALGTEYTEASGAVNTGDIALGRSADMFVRFGILYWQATSGSTNASLNTVLAVRPDPLGAWGTAPSSWGTLELGLTRTVAGGRVAYSGANSPFGDVYDSPTAPWSLTVLAKTSGDPSGPSAWGSGGATPWWVGYDAATGKWGVYQIVSGAAALVAGSDVTGPAHALARVSVGSGATSATFDFSVDGVNWTTLLTRTDTWNYRTYTVQDSTTYTVQRELRS